MEETNQNENEEIQQHTEEVIESELDRCEREKNEMVDLARRLKADFANAKKEQEREIGKIVQFANEDLLLKLLPIIDSFDLAIKHIPKDIEDHSFIAGINSIKQQLDGILKQVGVKEIDTKEKQFDMHQHEAMMEEEGEGQEGDIAQELQKGYTLHDKVLRPSKVSVIKKKES